MSALIISDCLEETLTVRCTSTRRKLDHSGVSYVKFSGWISVKGRSHPQAMRLSRETLEVTSFCMFDARSTIMLQLCSWR